MDTVGLLQPPHRKAEDRIGFLGIFASPALESNFGKQHFRDTRWLTTFLISAAMLRASLVLASDYQHFGLRQAFWLLSAGRFLFLLASVAVLIVLRRTASPATVHWLFFGWCFLVIALAVGALAARSPTDNRLLLMSFGLIIGTYCVTPLALSRQTIVALSFSALALYACRQSDGVTLKMISAAHALSHVFGAIISWRINHRRREMFLGAMREAELRTHLEVALAEVRTLRGLLCMCAWCKRIRVENETWEPVEKYVQSRTHAAFSHGICPECVQAQVGVAAPSYS